MKNRLLMLCFAMIILSLPTVAQEKDHAKASPSQPSQVASQEFDDCVGAPWCPRMTIVPQGTFIMGSPIDEPGRAKDEQPMHEVIIKAMAVGKFAVTRGQWGAFVSDTSRPIATGECAYAPAEHPSWKDPGFPQTDDHPVVCITWQDAIEYVTWLTQKTKHHYRLLTEAEREYAARGGTRSAYPWGAVASHENANYGTEQCCAGLVSGRDRWEYTSPVGSFPPNAFGLYDMQGNIFEWIQDCYADSYAGSPADGSAYEVKNCKQRVARGAAYADFPALVRSAARNYAPPPGDVMTITNYRSSGFGLRVARDIP